MCDLQQFSFRCQTAEAPYRKQSRQPNFRPIVIQGSGENLRGFRMFHSSQGFDGRPASFQLRAGQPRCDVREMRRPQPAELHDGFFTETPVR